MLRLSRKYFVDPGPKLELVSSFDKKTSVSFVSGGVSQIFMQRIVKTKYL
jgi:hypothetical protein